MAPGKLYSMMVVSCLPVLFYSSTLEASLLHGKELLQASDAIPPELWFFTSAFVVLTSFYPVPFIVTFVQTLRALRKDDVIYAYRMQWWNHLYLCCMVVSFICWTLSVDSMSKK